MKYILTVIFVSLLLVTNAQQLQTSSMYDVQGVLQNPAMAGMQEHNYIGLSYRTQWSGISGSPKTATAFGSFNLPNHNIGIGGYLYTDKTGPTSRNGIDISLAKHIVMDNDRVLSLGIETRFQQFVINVADLAATLGNDPVLAGGSSKLKYDAGFGIAYKTKRLQIGASVSQLVQSKLNYYTGNLNTTEQAKLYRHYYLHGAYKWDVDGFTTITPNFLLTYLPNAPADFQISARVEHRELFWWSVGYRASQSFIISAGLNINKKITLGYAYDNYINPVSNFDAGSNGNEFILKFNL